MQDTEDSNRLYDQAFIWDAVLPWLPSCKPRVRVLRRYASAGINFVSLTIGADRTDHEATLPYLTSQRKILAAHSHFRLVRRSDDLGYSPQDTDLGIGLNLQGTNPIAGSLELLAQYCHLGVRQVLLVYNRSNLVGGGCHDGYDEGLTKFGRRLIAEMNSLGIIVDCSHTGQHTSLQAIEASAYPVIFSHSNSYTLLPHPRNIRDSQAKACAESGGVIGVNGVGFLLQESAGDPVDGMVDHIAYFANLVGPDHVGLGLDYIYYPTQLYKLLRTNPATYPRGYPPPPWTVVRPSDLRRLTELLMIRGFQASEVKAILGTNFYRVAQAVWK